MHFDKRLAPRFMSRVRNVRSDSAVVVLFFSGHGVDRDGETELLATDFDYDSELLGLGVNDLIFEINGACGRATVIFLLDCSRENPANITFRGGLSDDSDHWRLQRQHGGSFFIGCSCKPGTVAIESPLERNSFFTKALLRHLPSPPGRTLMAAFMDVVDDVQAWTNHRQGPWFEGDAGRFVMFPVATLDLLGIESPPDQQPESTLRDAPPDDASSPAPVSVAPASPLAMAPQSAALDKLAALAGLSTIKPLFNALWLTAKMDHPDRTARSKHYNGVLYGSPGTGKTTVAKLYAEMLTELDVVQGAGYEELNGAVLSADGGLDRQQSTLTELQETGGVLLVDNAQRLFDAASSGSVDSRAFVSHLLGEMAKTREPGRALIVLLGAGKDKQQLAEVVAKLPEDIGAGLFGHFPKIFDLPDYSVDEMADMLAAFIPPTYTVSDTMFLRIAARHLSERRGTPGLGTAKGCRAHIDQVMRRQAERVEQAKQASPTQTVDEHELTETDILTDAKAPVTLPKMANRFALVIGCNKYPHTPLSKAVNDAAAMHKLLGDAGFDSTLLTDASLRDMRYEKDELVDKVQAATEPTVVVFFSGHGVDVANKTRLLPVDYGKKNEKGELVADNFGICVDDLVQALYKNGKGITLIFLADACRSDSNNLTWLGRSGGNSSAVSGADVARVLGVAGGDTPFQTRNIPDASVSPPVAVGQVPVKDNQIFFGYACKPGKQAGEPNVGENGYFTAALLTHLRTPGLDLSLAWKKVVRDVRESTRTGPGQVPHAETDLADDVVFFPGVEGA